MTKTSANKSKKKNRTVKKTSSNKTLAVCDVSNADNTSIKLTDYLAYMPGILMVGMIALTLFLDIMSPKMQDTQYEDFKNIFRVFDYLIITGGSIFVVVAMVQKRLKFWVRDYFFGAFLVCILISTCINGLNRDAAFGIPYRYIGIFNMFAFFIFYMKISGYIERVSFRYTVLTSYLVVADAVALSAIYEQYLGDIPAYQGKFGLSTIFINSNHYGYFLAMAIMIGIGYYMYEGQKKSTFGAISAIINLFVLAINNTLGAILSVWFCTFVTVIMVLVSEMKSENLMFKTSEKKGLTSTAKRAITLAIFGILAVVTATAISSSVRSSISELFLDIGSIIMGTSTGAEGSGRWNLWRTVTQYIAEKPLFGFGCEGITMRLAEEAGISDAHCELLTYAAYYGIPGAILYLAGVIAAAVRYFKNRQNLPSYCRIAFLGAASYFISSLVGVPIFNTAPFFFIFMGMATEEWK